MPYIKKQLLKYCLHKSSSRAYVRIGGKTYYLGKHGSEASRREYDRIIGEFIANGRQPFYGPDEVLTGSLIVRYLDYIAKEFDYSDSMRKPTPHKHENRTTRNSGQRPR